MSNVKAILKEKLLSMIKSISPPSGWKVLIVDAGSIRVLASVCTMAEIMEEGVSVAESITVSREQLPHMEAIYFLTPERDSIERLIQDFAGKPQYRFVHLFFTSQVPPDLFAMLQASPKTIQRVQTFIEINLDFIAYESQIYHFDMPNVLTTLFSPAVSESEKRVLKEKLADKLAMLCVVLGENPIIRWGKCQPIGEEIAKLTQERIDKFVKNSPNGAADFNEDRATLFVFDRTVDLLVGVLHEFTYQAMVNDLLPVENDRYLYSFTNATGATEEKTVVLNEEDPVWKELRHMHIADTSNWIIAKFNDFMKSNKKTIDHAEVTSLKDISEVMKSMPQFQEMKSKFSLHMDLANKCMNVFNELNLEQIGMLEQDLCMLEAKELSDRLKMQSLRGTLQEYLQSRTTPETRLRLLMTHILVRDGMKPGDRDHFARKAALTEEERQIIENLKYLNVNLDKASGARKRFKRPKRRKPMPENVYELSRYVPWVKEVLEDFAEGVLTADYAPFVREPAGTTGGKRKGLKSLKTVTRRRQTRFGDIKEEKEKMIFKGRVIVFIAGGCTYSETRTAYEIIKQYRWDVILGGSSIITPQFFLERLSELKGEES